MNWPVALFDLDGTLTDPEQGIVACIEHAFDRLGRKSPPRRALRGWIGPPLRASFLESLGGDDDLADRALAAYRERFGRVGLFENRLIGGIAAALDHLADRGVRCYVATSKPTVYARRIIEHFHLDHRFERVYGSELDGRRTDKSELLGWLMACESLSPAAAVMIGDRHHDMRGARDNGIHALGVTWGFGSRRELNEAGAQTTVDSVEQLLACWSPEDTTALEEARHER